MLTRLWKPIAESFRHRFGRLFRHEAQSDEYLETPAERRASGVHHDARAAGGHFAGNPDGGRGSDRNRHR